MKFTTYNDAETYINNSGVIDWEFGGNANLEHLTRMIYIKWDNETDQEDDAQFNNLLCDYLEFANENISDYSLRRD